MPMSIACGGCARSWDLTANSGSDHSYSTSNSVAMMPLKDGGVPSGLATT